MKSNAPLRVASTAVLTVPWPEIITTGSVSLRGAEALEHLEAVHAGHLDVEEHEIERLALGQGDAIGSGGGEQALVALVLEDHLQRLADARFIVYDQDARFHGCGDGPAAGLASDYTGQELGFLDDRHAERLGLLQLAASLLAGDDGGGLAADRR